MAGLAQALPEGGGQMRKFPRRRAIEEPDHWDRGALLRVRGEGADNTRPAECNEIAPSQ
jgi:hypothetical protein